MQRFAVIDTHALVWFFNKDKRLSKKAIDVLTDSRVELLIPLITLCEINHMHGHGRFGLSLSELQAHLSEVAHTHILAHQEDIISHLDHRLDIHDAIIVASAMAWEQRHRDDVCIVSRDESIRRHSPVPVVW